MRPGAPKRLLKLISLSFAGMLTVAACTSQPVGHGDQDRLASFVPGLEGLDMSDPANWIRELELRAQEEIRRCMSDLGFEYIPYIAASVEAPVAASQEEYARQYGFGIAVSLLQPQTASPAVDDPNLDIRQNLSEAAKEAYDAALHGVERTTQGGFDPLGELEASGCYNEAYAAMLRGDLAGDPEFWSLFGDDISDMQQRAKADSRIIALEWEWAQCMTEGGYNFTRMDEPETYILRRLESEGIITSLTFDDSGSFSYTVGGLIPGTPSYQSLESIIQEEIDIALLSYSCRDGFDEIIQSVFAEYETAFVAEHRSALERFKLEQGPS